MTTTDIKNMTPDMTKLPGGYIPKEVPTLVGNPNSTVRNINLNWPSYEGKYMAFVIEDAFTAEDCAKLIKMMDDAHVSAPVSVHGFMSDDNSKYEDVAGSIRTTMWTPELSESVWNIIKHHFSMRYMHDE